MNRLGLLAGVALVVGIGSAAMACEDEFFATSEPTVVEQQATTPQVTEPVAPTQVAGPTWPSCGMSSGCATEEPTAPTLPQGKTQVADGREGDR